MLFSVNIPFHQTQTIRLTFLNLFFQITTTHLLFFFSLAFFLTRRCKNDCNGKLHGNCGNDGVCQCQGGFGGDDCMEPRCPHDCNGVGECEPNGPNGSGVCHCDDTHGGSDCGTEICNTPQCVHGYCYADGKYSSEGAAREWSTVVIVIVIFIS